MREEKKIREENGNKKYVYTFTRSSVSVPSLSMTHSEHSVSETLTVASQLAAWSSH